MASITDLQHSIQNTVSRLSNFFLRTEDVEEVDGDFEKTFEWVNMGRIQDGEFSADPMTSDQDQDGRESTQLIEIEVSFVMQQASNEELATMSELAQPGTTKEGIELYGNGHRIYVSGRKGITTDEVNASSANEGEGGTLVFGTTGDQIDDENGIVFEEVLLSVSPTLDLGGEVSLIELSFTGIVELSQFEDLQSTHRIEISRTDS